MQEKRIKVLSVTNRPKVVVAGHYPSIWRRIFLGDTVMEPIINFGLELQLELPDKRIRPGHIIAITALRSSKFPPVTAESCLLKDTDKILARCMHTTDHPDGVTIGYFLSVAHFPDKYYLGQFPEWLKTPNIPIATSYSERPPKPQHEVYDCQWSDHLANDRNGNPQWSPEWGYDIRFKSTLQIQEKDIIQYGPMKFRVYYLSLNGSDSRGKFIAPEEGYIHYKAESIETGHDRLTINDFKGCIPEIIHRSNGNFRLLKNG